MKSIEQNRNSTLKEEPQAQDGKYLLSINDSGKIRCHEDSSKQFMGAVKSAEISLIKNLIDRGFVINFEINGETPAEHAYSNQKFDILLLLLESNSKYPRNYKNENAPEPIQKFHKMCNEFHESICLNNVQRLEEVIGENPNLKYIFDSQNNSAMKTAILTKKFDIYEFLYVHNLFLSPHEDFNEIVSNLKDSERRKLRDINSKLSDCVYPEEMTILMRNCNYGCGLENRKLYQEFVHGAFQFLFSIPQIATYLQVVAARRDFTITFDFQRDTIQFLDPSAESSANGLFYLNGRIYIAAGDMLNPDKKYQIYSVMAHELCHSAISLLYENDAKPYYESNTMRKNEFDNISNYCDVQKARENLIDLVYECYDEEMYHAELIVRPPQMMALYHENQEVLSEKVEMFGPLFEYFRDVCLVEMERKLPKIKAKFCPMRRIKRQKMMLATTVITLLMLLIASLLLGLYFWHIQAVSLSWNSLSESQREIVKKSSIVYSGVEIELRDIFAENSIIYNQISSSVINNALNGQTSNLTKEILTVYDHLIFFNWNNMTARMKEKVLESKVKFQGLEVLLGDILPKNSSSLNSFESKHFKKLLRDQNLQISQTLSTSNYFVVKRTFIENVRRAKEKSYDEIIEELPLRKNFLLCDKAGEGKSVAMQVFWTMLKEKFPTKWIVYIDLKKYFDTYDKLNDNNDYGQFISTKMLKLNDFERSIFNDLFVRDDIILLWDGVDELSSTHIEIIINLMKNIKKSTEINQFISTRPYYEDNLKISLNIQSFRFYPMSEVKKFEFLLKYTLNEKFADDEANKVNYLNSMIQKHLTELSNNSFELHNSSVIMTEKLHELIEISQTDSNLIVTNLVKSKKILAMVEASSKHSLTNPLLLKIFVHITNCLAIENGIIDIFTIYEIFVNEKIKIFHEKNLEGSYKMEENVLKAHQAYALKSIVKYQLERDTNWKLEDLDVMKYTEKVLDNDISRYGILTIFTKRDFEFIHRTFAEFFVAKYLTDNATNRNHKKIDTRIRMAILKLINDHKEKYEVIKNFLNCHESKSNVKV